MQKGIIFLTTLSYLASAGIAQEKILPPALSSLVASERAFAHLSVEKGAREAFLAFFAEEGINFTPHPTNTRELMRKRPATRPSVTLDWEPILAGVSQAGDLGYTTGPYVLTDQSPEKRPPQHGYFFSVWKIQTDGSWKVVLDAGIRTPPPDPLARRTAFTAARQIKMKSAGPEDPSAERSALLELERRLLKSAESRGVTAAALDYLDDDSRFDRDGMFPLEGKTAILQYLTRDISSMKWEPIKTELARSADLAYTYGSCAWKATGNEGAAESKGYYARVWKKNAAGQWKIAIDTVTVVPADQK